jgi:nucleotide-binding universal stress UspA family protein
VGARDRPVVVVGVDGSEASAAALRWALDEAERRDAEVEAVCAWEYSVASPPYLVGGGSVHEYVVEDAKRTVHLAVESALAERPGCRVPVREEAVPGPPAMALLRRAGPADLVVVGSRGRGGFRSLLLGSVSHQVVTHAECPVVVVRPTRRPGAVDLPPVEADRAPAT